MSDSAIAKYRSARAVEMRINGASYEEIAEELEYADKSGAWRAVDRALKARTDRAVDIYHVRRFAVIDEIDMRTDRILSLGVVRPSALDPAIRAMREKARLLFGV